MSSVLRAPTAQVHYIQQYPVSIQFQFYSRVYEPSGSIQRRVKMLCIACKIIQANSWRETKEIKKVNRIRQALSLYSLLYFSSSFVSFLLVVVFFIVFGTSFVVIVVVCRFLVRKRAAVVSISHKCVRWRENSIPNDVLVHPWTIV